MKATVPGDLRVTELGFSKRLLDIFESGMRGGGRHSIEIRTLGDFAKYTKEDLAWLLGFGKAALRETKEVLARHGYPLNSRNLNEVSIDTLDLSVRTNAVLKAANIATIGTLIPRTAIELLKLTDMSRTSINNIEKALAAQGHSLRKI